MQERIHAWVLGDTLCWTHTRPDRRECGSWSDDLVIYTQSEGPFSVLPMGLAHGGPSADVCGLMGGVTHLWTEWIGADELPIRYVWLLGRRPWVEDLHASNMWRGLLWWQSGTEFTHKAGDARELGSIPGSGRSAREGHGSPLQYSCLENPMDRGAWWATVQRVTKSWTRLSDLALRPAVYEGRISQRNRWRTGGDRLRKGEN